MKPMSTDWSAYAETCDLVAKDTADYINRLCAMGILPYDLTFTEHRLCDLLKKITNKKPTTFCTNYGCVCRKGRAAGLASGANQEIQYIKNQQRTFNCLDCLKTSGKSHSLEKCRITHT